MTREQAAKWLSDLLKNSDLPMPQYEDALGMAIEALQAQADGEYISKDTVIEWLKDQDIIKTDGQETEARRQLSQLPSVAIPSAEPKTGHWIYDRTRDWDGECKYECSECGLEVQYKCPYCYHCGADMRGEDDGR